MQPPHRGLRNTRTCEENDEKTSLSTNILLDSKSEPWKLQAFKLKGQIELARRLALQADLKLPYASRRLQVARPSTSTFETCLPPSRSSRRYPKSARTYPLITKTGHRAASASTRARVRRATTGNIRPAKAPSELQGTEHKLKGISVTFSFNSGSEGEK